MGIKSSRNYSYYLTRGNLTQGLENMGDQRAEKGDSGKTRDGQQYRPWLEEQKRRGGACRDPAEGGIPGGFVWKKLEPGHRYGYNQRHHPRRREEVPGFSFLFPSKFPTVLLHKLISAGHKLTSESWESSLQRSIPLPYILKKEGRRGERGSVGPRLPPQTALSPAF